MRPARSEPRTRSARSGRVASCALLLSLGMPGTASAFAFFDGRLEVHGYAAQQVRSLADDFDPDEEFDLAQWYDVVSVEIEAKPFPEGFGPLETVELFASFERRTRARPRRGGGNRTGSSKRNMPAGGCQPLRISSSNVPFAEL